MKLLRYGNKGEEKPGVLDDSGHIRDLFHYLTDIDSKSLADPSLLMQLQALDLHQLPLVSPDVRIGSCVGTPGKLVCVGFNSALHTQQMGIKPIAKRDMVVFMKPSSSVCGPFDPILYTRHTKKLDWEAELGVVIGKQGKYIKKEDAHQHIFGYTCINDLSERFLQLETEDTQFTKGKCFDNAAPMGPYLVTKDDIPDASNLEVKLWVNGMLRQEFNTRDYIHNPAEVISYLSQYFTLYPGDVISMGSAPGNAIFWGEDQFLTCQDNVVLWISELGQQEQTVILEEV
jgi:2-keto-4-pentenoate hydratase/2-oxohepta-3-ene-1,7-dioic acid hydratase in catechol pathway